MFVVTADQKRSTRRGDRVPEALDLLGAGLDRDGVVLPFERTVGDEIQGVLGSPAAAVRAVTALVRLGGWRTGLGVGPVDLPLPSSTRAASGPAFLAAREAVETARSSPADLRVVRGDGGVSGDRGHHYGVVERARHAESALWLLTALLRRRTTEGWEIVDMAETGLSGKDIADRLGISPSAVSQRLSRAAFQEGRRGAELAEALLAEADA